MVRLTIPVGQNALQRGGDVFPVLAVRLLPADMLDAGKAVLPQLVIDHLQRILAALTTGDLFKDHLHGGDTRSCTGHV